MLIVAVTCSTLPPHTTLASGSTLPITEYGTVGILCAWTIGGTSYKWSNPAHEMGSTLTATCVDAGGYTPGWQVADTCVPAPAIACYEISKVPCAHTSYL